MLVKNLDTGPFFFFFLLIRLATAVALFYIDRKKNQAPIGLRSDGIYYSRR